MEILKDQDQDQAEGIMVFFCVDDSGRVAKVARGRPSIYIIYTLFWSEISFVVIYKLFGCTISRDLLW